MTTVSVAAFCRRVLRGAFLLAGMCSPLAGSFSLPPCDWQNRGYAFDVVVDAPRSLVYLPMDGGVDNDLSVFDCANPAQIKYLGLVKGFGTHVGQAGTNLFSTAKDKGLCIWTMADPLHPTLKARVPGTESWWNGSSYSSDVIAFHQEVLFHLQWDALTTYRVGESNQLVSLQSFTNLSLGPGASLLVKEDLVIAVYQYCGVYTVCVFQGRANSLTLASKMGITSEALKSYAGGADMAVCRGGRFLVMSTRGEDLVHVVDLVDPAHPVELEPYHITQPPLACMVAIDDEHVLIADLGVVLQVSASGRLLPVSNALTLNSSSIRGVCSGSYAYLTGFNTDLTTIEVSDRSNPAVLSRLDPNPGVYGMVVDQDCVYKVDEISSDEGYRGYRLVVARRDSATGRLAPSATVQEGALQAAACNGTVVADNYVELSVYKRQPSGEHVFRSRARYSYSQYSYQQPLFANEAYAVVGTNAFHIDASQSLLPLAALPGPASGLFGHFVLCADGDDAIVVDLAQGSKMVQRLVGPVFSIQAVGMRAVIKRQDSLYIVESDADGNLTSKEWFGYPTEPGYGKWNVSFDENFLILWSTATANIYSLSGAKPPRLLGSCAIPQNYCHGGWYGFLSEGNFYTADAFAGIIIMRLDAGHAILSIAKATDESASVEWNTVEGRLYDVMGSSDLKEWKPLARALRGTGHKVTQKGLSGTSATMFYRVLDVGE